MFMDGERDVSRPEAPIVGGREIARRQFCDDCVQRQQAASARVEAAQRNHVAKLEGEDRENAIRQLLQEMGANPWEHGHATLDNFDPVCTDTGTESRAALGAARAFAAAVLDAKKFAKVRGLYLWGNTGPGKTHLAVGVVRHLLVHGYNPKDIVFDYAAELIARIQDTYGRRDDRTMDVLEKRFNAGLWILDDLGTERYSDDAIRHLTLIFARRAMRPNLITSNYSPAQLHAERPELERVLSRLGPAYFDTKEVKGRDRRFD